MACTCSSHDSQVEFSGSYMNGYPGIVDSWIGLSQICPRNPLDLIAYAKLGNTVGAFKNSSTYINPSSGWLGDGCSIQSEPYCVALGSDNKQMEADADQWNFSHRTNSDNVNIALPLKKNIVSVASEWGQRLIASAVSSGDKNQEACVILQEEYQSLIFS